jgi:F-type H+-transporting ATPase subunit b
MSFDWRTFALQTVNVLILIWLLRRFFWRPVADMIEQRRQRAQGLLDEARRDREAAARALAQARRRDDGFSREREAMLAQVRREAAEAGEALMAQVKAEIAQARLQAETLLARQRQAAEREWSAQAGGLAVDIASRLAARLDGAAVRAAFLRWLIEKLAAQSDPVRQSLLAGGGPIELVAAAPLDAAEQAQIAAALQAALGAAPKLVFSVDPALIAGLELKSPHFALTNSWRADLAEILAELAHDDRA